MERILGQVNVGATKETHYTYEIPILSSLRQLLSDPFVLEEVRQIT